jgi:hypothetical protein
LRRSGKRIGTKSARKFPHAVGDGRLVRALAVEQPPPPAEPIDDVPDPSPAAGTFSGEARKACGSPETVSPDPATCPRSFSETASVVVHPGKESSS